MGAAIIFEDLRWQSWYRRMPYLVDDFIHSPHSFMQK